VKVGIINVTGYAGIELVRILSRHPEAEIVTVTGRSSAGKKLGEVFPHLSDVDLSITEELTETVDVVFSALPHAASAERLGPIVESGIKAIDISADFRLKDVSEYEAWYKVDHPYPQFIEDAVYGLPELHRDEIAGASLVANPGCYPTASILALAPAAAAGLIEDDVIVDGKTGVSGAGRKGDVQYLYTEINESVRAYSVGGHRHMPEMAQELGGLNGTGRLQVTFLAHLIPMTRGILASCYARFKDNALPSGQAGREQLTEIYRDFYENHPFVHVVDQPPATKQTLGNNDCRVYPTIDQTTGRLIAIGCIDNLVKGAAGSAVQNMNLMFGVPEQMGLEQLALFP
jgi:N-acetyl-gamma-glutamyl-phosphate reductase